MGVLTLKPQGWWGEMGGLENMSTWLVGWGSLEAWLWSWRTAGVSVLMLFSGVGLRAVEQPSCGCCAGHGALMWSHSSP